jgi:transposase-like protein
MATSLAHAHRVPHTVKPPARCPHCGSTRLIRKGTRRKKLEVVQLWQCKLCRRVFTPAPAELRYKTYPLRIILDGVTLYNLGYSLPEAAAKLKSAPREIRELDGLIAGFRKLHNLVAKFRQEISQNGFKRLQIGDDRAHPLRILFGLQVSLPLSAIHYKAIGASGCAGGGHTPTDHSAVPRRGATLPSLVNSLSCPTFAKRPIEFQCLFSRLSHRL